MSQEKQDSRPKGRPKVLYLVLHMGFLLSSFSGVCAKLAARQEAPAPFLFWYGMDLLIMAVYAVLWQQILKRLPLTVAYANKPVGLIWGMLWGWLLFGERISGRMLLGAGIIFAGIYMVVTDDK